jgi:biotin transport system substrate-specific component
MMEQYMNYPIKSAKTIALSNDKPLVVFFWISTFSVLTAIAAQIEIPLQPVPFTLQTFFVLLAGAVLGSRNGALSMIGYLTLGIFGLPVFAGGAMGFAKLIGPTGGYLLSFPLAAFIVGMLSTKHHHYLWMLFSVFLGSLVIFAIGTIQLNYMYLHNWKSALNSGFLIFSVWDLIKVGAVAAIAHYYRRTISF